MERLKDWLKEWWKVRVFPTLEQWLWRRLKRGKVALRDRLAHIEIGNLLAALSATGLMALGVVPMSLNLLIALAVFLVVLGVVGRYIDSVEDDMERLIKYEEYLGESPSGSVPSNARTDGVQPQDFRNEE